MTLFHVIYVRRSDGKTEVVTKSRLREKNEPTKEQLDSKPNSKGVSDYYRLLSAQDTKHLDWRRKLAGMLVKELDNKEYGLDKAYILEDLPEGYRLYEHVKSKAADAEAKSTKTHAGGGNDRQDAYLYGYPGGRKKRFRSPADFFPHLLWLCTDESGNPQNCTCKICSPDEIQTDVKPGAPARGGTVTMKVENQDLKNVVRRNPVVEIPAPVRRPSATQSPVVRTPAAASPVVKPEIPTKQESQLQNQGSTHNQVLPLPRTLDQQIDISFGQLNFRLGELVWFNKGATWALGVITRRWLVRTLPLPQGRRYLIQPLSAPYLPQHPVVIDAENNLRPWLAWSAPAYCHPGLNQYHTLSFPTMDWHALAGGRFGDSNSEIVIVDASILAARAIDASYTPFGYLNSSPANKNDTESKPHHTTHNIMWNGAYIGGERVWVGDPVRLRASAGEDVLVVTQIEERVVPPSFAPGSTNKPTSRLILIGNVLSCSTLASDAARPEQESLIPTRMRKDLETRNAAIAAINAPKSYWKITRVGQGVEAGDIKGRWYETSIMAPNFHGQSTYNDCVRSGQTDSVARTFNARIEMSKVAGIRHDTREAALGRAVPQDTLLREGMDVPLPNELPRNGAEELRPQQSMGPSPVQTQSGFDTQMTDQDADQNDGLVDQFMNLGEQETESMPGFGQEYGSQGWG